MKITKKQLRQIIREEVSRVVAEQNRPRGTGGGLSAEFDGESVMLNGQPLDQEELAREVSNDDDWDDNFDHMGSFAAKALKLNHGVVTVTDYEQSGKAWTVDDFIELKKSIAAEYDED